MDRREALEQLEFTRQEIWRDLDAAFASTDGKELHTTALRLWKCDYDLDVIPEKLTSMCLGAVLMEVATRRIQQSIEAEILNFQSTAKEYLKGRH